MGSRFVVPTLAACVDLVVHLALAPDGRRRVDEVVAVPGRVESDVIETEPIFTRLDGELERAGGQPPHPERFARVGIDLGSLRRCARRREVGALLGVVLGAGLLLAWLAVSDPRPESRSTRNQVFHR